MFRNLSSFPSLGIPNTSGLQSRLFKFLLRRFLGPFLANEPNPSQLDLQLSEGVLRLNDLAFNCENINEKLAGAGLRVSSGWIGSVLVKIPWKEIMWQGEISIQITDVDIEIEPNCEEVTYEDSGSDQDDGADDLWNSLYHDASQSLTSSQNPILASSVYIASEYLRTTTPSLSPDEQSPTKVSFSDTNEAFLVDPDLPPANTPQEGVHLLANLIQRILARVRVTLSNVNIRIHIDDEVLKLNLSEIEYFDSVAETANKDAFSNLEKKIKISDINISKMKQGSVMHSSASSAKTEFQNIPEDQLLFRMKRTLFDPAVCVKIKNVVRYSGKSDENDAKKGPLGSDDPCVFWDVEATLNEAICVLGPLEVETLAKAVVLYGAKGNQNSGFSDDLRKTYIPPNSFVSKTDTPPTNRPKILVNAKLKTFSLFLMFDDIPETFWDLEKTNEGHIKLNISDLWARVKKWHKGHEALESGMAGLTVHECLFDGSYEKVIWFEPLWKQPKESENLYPVNTEKYAVWESDTEFCKDRRKGEVKDVICIRKLDKDASLDIQTGPVVIKMDVGGWVFKLFEVASAIERGLLYIDCYSSEKATQIGNLILEDLGNGVNNFIGHNIKSSESPPKRWQIGFDKIRIHLRVPDANIDYFEYVIILLIFSNLRYHPVSFSVDIHLLSIQDNPIQNIESTIPEKDLPIVSGKIAVECYSVNVFAKTSDEAKPVCIAMLKNDVCSLLLAEITLSKPPLNNELSTPKVYEQMGIQERDPIFWNFQLDSLDQDTSFNNQIPRVEVDSERVFQFKQKNMKTSKILVEAAIPQLNACLDKHMYGKLREVLGHLILWFSQNDPAPVPKAILSRRSSGMSSRRSSYYFEAVDFSQYRDGILKVNQKGMNTISVSAIISKASLKLIGVPEEQTSKKSINPKWLVDLGEIRFFAVRGYQSMLNNYYFLDCENISCQDLTEAKGTKILFRGPNETGKFSRKRSAIGLSVLEQQNPLHLQDRNIVVALSMDALTVAWSETKKYPERLLKFFEEPESPLSNSADQRTLKIFVSAKDLCVKYVPQNICITFHADSIKAISQLTTDSTTVTARLIFQKANLMLLDNKESKVESQQETFHSYSREYWISHGFAKIAELDYLELFATQRLSRGLPSLEVKINNQLLSIGFCADSLVTLHSHFAEIQSKKASFLTKRKKVQISGSQLNDILADLDDEIFKAKPQRPKERLFVQEDLLDVDEDFFNSTESRVFTHADCDYDILDPTINDWDFEGLKSVKGPDDDFHYVRKHSLQGVVKTLDDKELSLIENYMDSGILDLPFDDNKPLRKLYIAASDINIKIQLFDGYDWEANQSKAFTAYEIKRKEREAAMTPSSPISKSPPNKIYFPSSLAQEYGLPFSPTTAYGSPDDRCYIDLDSNDRKDTFSTTSHEERCIKKFKRSRSSKVDLCINGLCCEFENYHDRKDLVSKTSLNVKSIEILDNVHSSVWKKFMTTQRSETNFERESNSSAISVKLRIVRPRPEMPEEEWRIRVKLLPLRFHVDQDTLEFIIEFGNQIILAQSPTAVNSEGDLEPYIQLFELYPLKLKVDYKPKRIDYGELKQGKFAELLNIFQLDGAELALKDVRLTGISGFKKLAEGIAATWLPHVTKTQISGMVSGLSPFRSLVNFGSGVADLVLLPAEQYQKDGKLMRGIQKGASAFAKSTTLEAIRLGTKLAVGTQILLEQADDILSFDSSDVSATVIREDEEQVASKFSNQPSTVSEGVEMAYQSLSKNITAAAQTIYAIPMEVYEKTGSHGTIKAVVRAIPVAVLRPMIGATEAMSKTLLGLKNQIDPASKKEMDDKYKGSGV